MDVVGALVALIVLLASGVMGFFALAGLLGTLNGGR